MSFLMKILKYLFIALVSIASAVAVLSCVKVAIQITRRKKIESYPEFVSESFTI